MKSNNKLKTRVGSTPEEQPYSPTYPQPRQVQYVGVVAPAGPGEVVSFNCMIWGTRRRPVEIRMFVEWLWNQGFRSEEECLPVSGTVVFTGSGKVVPLKGVFVDGNGTFLEVMYYVSGDMYEGSDKWEVTEISQEKAYVRGD